MIKRKVKPRKRKNPYRKDQIDDGINLEKYRYSYKYGYLYGLINGLRQLEFYPFWPDNESIIIDEVYFIKGHDKGFEDSTKQLQLIPKNKLKVYIKELEEEIDAL